jgi:hypothetical protein
MCAVPAQGSGARHERRDAQGIGVEIPRGMRMQRYLSREDSGVKAGMTAVT